MGSYIVRIKVLPTGPEVPAQTLLDSITSKLESEMTIRSSKEEPIAFGLYSLTVDVVAPEVEGMVDRVEKAVSTAENVAQSDLVGVSRMSSTLKQA
jgi:translation elongation factor aEF-1 beta